MMAGGTAEGGQVCGLAEVVLWINLPEKVFLVHLSR